MSLLETIQRESASTRAEALKDYSRILGRAASPAEGDTSRLVDVLETLGLSMADVSADLNAMREASQLRAQLLSFQQLADIAAKAAGDVKSIDDGFRLLLQDMMAGAAVEPGHFALWLMQRINFAPGREPELRQRLSDLMDRQQQALTIAEQLKKENWNRELRIRTLEREHPRVLPVEREPIELQPAAELEPEATTSQTIEPMPEIFWPGDD